MGDFNVAPEPIDFHDTKRLKKHVDFHPEARAALERVREWGFVDIFRLHHPEEPEQYTFWDYRVRDALERGVGWRVTTSAPPNRWLASPPEPGLTWRRGGRSDHRTIPCWWRSLPSDSRALRAQSVHSPWMRRPQARIKQAESGLPPSSHLERTMGVCHPKIFAGLLVPCSRAIH